jgi:hypothetical protein
MNAASTTGTVQHRPFFYRRRVRRQLAAQDTYLPPTRYIPHSTADLWRSARRRPGS